MTLKLETCLNPEEFITHYWSREELSVFCRDHLIPDSVSRHELTERIYQYLKEKKTKES